MTYFKLGIGTGTINQLMGSQSSSPDNLVSKKNAVINRIKNCTCFLFVVIYISVDRDRCM
jgi:hypothetical protein